MAASLRASAPYRVLTGFGRAVAAACRYATPGSLEELAELLARAQAEGLPIAFRGAGRSYGDAALSAPGLVIDTTGWDRMLSWDPASGIAEAQPGLTIEGLWRRTLMDGYWPAVVPGTMAPTLAGCLAANIHGKNSFKVGSIGDHVLDFDLMSASGDIIRCSRAQNADVFHAAIGGAGLLGAFTRIRLQLKRVESGSLLVRAVPTRTLEAMFDLFEDSAGSADYLVGWLDCTAGGRGLGRGLVHLAEHLSAADDPDGAGSFKTERQTLPGRLLGVPRSLLWRLMRPFMNDPGVRLVNAGRYWSGRLQGDRSYLQSHVAFSFLLDYVPDWRLAYGLDGFVQYQLFVPHGRARQVFREVIERTQARRLPAYLGVLKRHRPDPFLLTHALDGWSLALDFPARDRGALFRLTDEISALVCEAGGRFYFAKDSVIRAPHAEATWGGEALDRFFALKRRLDPQALFASDLARRVFPERLAELERGRFLRD